METAASDRVRALTEARSGQLEKSVTVGIEETKAKALADLQTQLIELLNQAERHIHRHVETTIVARRHRSDQEPGDLTKYIDEQMERSDQNRVDTVASSQADILVMRAASELMIRVQDQLGSTLSEVRTVAAQQAKGTALGYVNPHSAEIEQKVLEHLRLSLAEFHRQQAA